MAGVRLHGIVPCFLVMSLVSCASVYTVSVPFENERIEQNLYVEYYTIAQEYRELKKYDKAIEYYKKASRLKSLRNDCYYGISVCYACNKDWEKARKNFEHLLKADPDNQNLAQSLAYVEAMSGNLEKAEKLYAEFFEKNSDDVQLLKDYLNLLMAMKKMDEAKVKYDFLVEKFPDDKDILTFKESFPESKEKDNPAEEDGEQEYVDDGED